VEKSASEAPAREERSTEDVNDKLEMNMKQWSRGR
jgi:hypothetical protein